MATALELRLWRSRRRRRGEALAARDDGPSARADPSEDARAERGAGGPRSPPSSVRPAARDGLSW